MELLSEEQVKEAYELISWREKRSIAELSREEVLLGLQYVIARMNQNLNDWLHFIEFDLNSNHVYKEDIFTFEGKMMLFNLPKYSSLSNVISRIEDSWSDHISKVKNEGKNIENFIPFGLEMLFHNKLPISGIEILEHFVDGNFCFIKTKTTGLKYNKRRKYDQRKTYEREFVIERWGPVGENYKTKQKKYEQQFKQLKELKTAPKAKVIETRVKKKLKSKYDTFQLFEIISEDGDSYVNLNEGYDFIHNKKTHIIFNSVTRPWVVKNDGEKVWIKYREDTYDSNGQYIRSHDAHDIYFQLNEFGGISQIDKNPFNTSDYNVGNEPEALRSPSSRFDAYLLVSEDESEIIEYTPYEHISFELVKETFEAKEYLIINNVAPELFKVTQYFALYDGIWIESTSRNPKVKEMLDVYALADKLEVE